MKLWIAVCFAVMTLAACVSAGNQSLREPTPDTLVDILQPGTSQAGVADALGDPLSVTFTDSGRETWFYELVEGRMSAQSYIPVVSMLSSGMEGRKSCSSSCSTRKNASTATISPTAPMNPRPAYSNKPFGAEPVIEAETQVVYLEMSPAPSLIRAKH